jgi:AraC-like DNA-binding protein
MAQGYDIYRESHDSTTSGTTPAEMLTLLEEELMCRLCETAGLGLVGHLAATVFAINPAEPVDWGELAGGAGYFDQAHFGHEFRAFTGLTPTRYLEVRRRFLREHPGHVLDSWPLPAD